jgi:hypothetical protein
MREETISPVSEKELLRKKKNIRAEKGEIIKQFRVLHNQDCRDPYRSPV